MIWTKKFEEHPFWESDGDGDGEGDGFFKASIPPSIRSSINPFLQIILALKGYSAAWSGINSIPQTAATTFVVFLFYACVVSKDGPMPLLPMFDAFERMRKEELTEFFPDSSGLLSQGGQLLYL